MEEKFSWPVNTVTHEKSFIPVAQFAGIRTQGLPDFFFACRACFYLMKS
jgi:hypothetical protein